MLNLSQVPVTYIKGIGPQKAKEFKKLSINSIEDLLYHFPRRYEDRSSFVNISQIREGQYYTLKAEVLARGERTSFRRHIKILEIVVGDHTGKLFCIWFNQPYLKDYFKPGVELILYGRVERYRDRLQMVSPEFELIENDRHSSLHMGRITPVYTLPKGITQRRFRQIIKEALHKYIPKINDFLPYDIRCRLKLLNIAQALLNIHFPKDLKLGDEAFRRLSFEEFFIFQIPVALRKSKSKAKPGISHQTEGKLIEDFIKNLPFRLTPSQERVVSEIKKDMASPQPMRRLLQGDVGSGKTVVAMITSLMAIQGGYQVAFMVPTEILAKQHYSFLSSHFLALSSLPKTALLLGSLSKEEKIKISTKIKEGKIDLVIGTHALLEKGIEFKNLGLVIIDEQHKFGVGQRALLPKKGINPDCLIMTATPIPRSLAITLYGDLDISIISELPPGRTPIKTLFFPKEEAYRAYNLAKQEIRKGHQVYIIYPVIEGSSDSDILGARLMYEEFRKGEFKDFRIGLIHGRLPQRQQDNIMGKFQRHQLDILVATSVLEVGIDIPNATCMIIQEAQRFGLAQLHQLRGRIGRSPHTESFCILIAEIFSSQAKTRLEAILRYNDGFKIAEEDLRMRGPGEFFGERQHGLSEMKIANPLTQLELLRQAKEEAEKIIQQDPDLKLPSHRLIKEKLLNRFPDYQSLVLVG